MLWDKFYQKTATALAAYLPPKSVYQSCTVTQAASRIRAFLAVDYSSMRTGNTITLQIKTAVKTLSLCCACTMKKLKT